LVEYYWEDDEKNDNDGEGESGEHGQQLCSLPREGLLSKQAESEIADDLSFASVDLEHQSTSLNDNGPDFAAGGSASSADHSPINAQHDTTASSITMSLNGNALSPGATRNSLSRVEEQSQQSIAPFKPQNGYHVSRVMKQRFSSGVWIAGQYEIEDSRGILHLGSNQVVEEEVFDPNAKSHDEPIDGSSTASSLNRTTWDLLPEKWLGLG
jgi:hypothetical protein